MHGARRLAWGDRGKEPPLPPPWWLRLKRTRLQCRRPGLDLRVRKIPQRRKCLHTPVFLPGEFHGQKSLAGYSPRGRRRIGCDWQLTLPAPSTSPQGKPLAHWRPCGPGPWGKRSRTDRSFSSVQSLSRAQLFATPGLQPTRLLCPWGSPGKNAGVGSHFLLWGIFLTQGLNPCLLQCRWILYYLSHQGSPRDAVNENHGTELP